MRRNEKFYTTGTSYEITKVFPVFYWVTCEVCTYDLKLEKIWSFVEEAEQKHICCRCLPNASDVKYRLDMNAWRRDFNVWQDRVAQPPKEL